jgi:hypothetical protein
LSVIFLSGFSVQACQAGLWIAGSLVAYVLIAHVAWLVQRRLGSSDRAGWLKPVGRAGSWAFRIGVPYLALGGWPMRRGAIPASAMGWVGPGWSSWTWFEMAGRGALVGLVVFVGLVLARFYVERASRSRRKPMLIPEPSGLPWWEHLAEIAAIDVHWAFYWAGMAVVLGDGYIGLWAGLGLLYLESALDPFWRQDLGSPVRSSRRWQRAALALGLAMVFLQIGNLWICIAIHWLLEAVLLPLSFGYRSAAQMLD